MEHNVLVIAIFATLFFLATVALVLALLVCKECRRQRNSWTVTKVTNIRPGTSTTESLQRSCTIERSLPSPPCHYSKRKDILSTTDVTESYGYQSVGGTEEKKEVPTVSRDHVTLLTELSYTGFITRCIGVLRCVEEEQLPILISYTREQVKPQLQLVWRNIVGVILQIQDHRNILKSVGICYENDIIYLAQYFTDTITLRSYLKSEVRHKESSRDRFISLLTAVHDVVCGLEFLFSHGCCHPGLCGQRILVDVRNTCKLYDFCKEEDAIYVLEQFDLHEDEDVRTSLSPESVFLGEYTSKSDVWSLGIVMWEIFSYGAKAFPNLSLEDFEKRIREQQRLEQPIGMTSELFKVMESCWSQRSSQRPSIIDLVETIRSVSSILEQLSDGTISVDVQMPLRHDHDCIKQNDDKDCELTDSNDTDSNIYLRPSSLGKESVRPGCRMVNVITSVNKKRTHHADQYYERSLQPLIKPTSMMDVTERDKPDGNETFYMTY